MSPYSVTVGRRGIPSLEVRLLVRADSKDAAGDLASAVAEQRHGGLFEARSIRRAPQSAEAVFDTA